MGSSIYGQIKMFETDIETLVSPEHKCRKIHKLVDKEGVAANRAYKISSSKWFYDVVMAVSA